jgi:short-chain Z-isoprenyl diphosphate synthase
VRAAAMATKDYGGMQLTIAAAYSGRQEISDAVRSLLSEQLEEGKTLAQAIVVVTPDALQ